MGLASLQKIARSRGKRTKRGSGGTAEELDSVCWCGRGGLHGGRRTTSARRSLLRVTLPVLAD